MMWGKLKENGIWIALSKDYKFKFFGHDSMYIAFWKFRCRVMK